MKKVMTKNKEMVSIQVASRFYSIDTPQGRFEME